VSSYLVEIRLKSNSRRLTRRPGREPPSRRVLPSLAAPDAERGRLGGGFLRLWSEQRRGRDSRRKGGESREKDIETSDAGRFSSLRRVLTGWFGRLASDHKAPRTARLSNCSLFSAYSPCQVEVLPSGRSPAAPSRGLRTASLPRTSCTPKSSYPAREVRDAPGVHRTSPGRAGVRSATNIFTARSTTCRIRAVLDPDFLATFFLAGDARPR
jgi:hypothetical protein